MRLLVVEDETRLSRQIASALLASSRLLRVEEPPQPAAIAAQPIAQRDRKSEARISAGMNIRAGGASNVAELTGRRLARPANQISARISCATASAERIAPST